MEGQTTVLLSPPNVPESNPLLNHIVNVLEQYFIEQQQNIKASEIRSITVHYINDRRIVNDIFANLRADMKWNLDRRNGTLHRTELFEIVNDLEARMRSLL